MGYFEVSIFLFTINIIIFDEKLYFFIFFKYYDHY
ncbi:MAG: hypothetical protein ACI976_002405 [Aureispira sp.]